MSNRTGAYPVLIIGRDHVRTCRAAIGDRSTTMTTRKSQENINAESNESVDIFESFSLYRRSVFSIGVRTIFSRGAEPSLPEKIFRQRPKNCCPNLQNYCPTHHPVI